MLTRDLLDLLVPPTCLVCRFPGDVLCRRCRRGLPWLPERCCPRCALPLPCGGRCPAAGHAYSSAWAPFAYEGAARTLVTSLKFRGTTAATGVLTAAMAATVPVGLLEGATLVPVPAHPGRRRRRGFNHAGLLAAALGSRSGRPVAGRALSRSGRGRQLGAGREERLGGSGLAFRARGAAPAATIALVDDVHTTGATLHACARVLIDAGAERVVAVTAVRTLR